MEQEYKEYSKKTRRPVKISWDGYYPYCPTCGRFDLDETLDKESCHWCEQLLDWDHLD